MFDRRLTILLSIFGVALGVIVLRLGQLQIVRAGYYRDEARQSVLNRPVTLPFVRGSILDRTGRTLVHDEACWDLAVEYEVIAADAEDDPEALAAVSRRWRVSDLGADAGEEQRAAAARQALDAMWSDMVRFAPERELTVELLRDRAASIHRRVQAIRRAVARHRGFDAPVAEEVRPHALLTELDDQQHVRAREVFAAYPWVQVETASVRRFAEPAEPFAHVLGRVGRVTAKDIASDPASDDPFAAYRGDEVKGITGVEWLAERALRGRRGQLTLDRERNVVPGATIVPANGDDVRVTIHAELQRRLYGLLAENVNAVSTSSGGAVVVVHVPTRDVLALVSYPSFDPNRFDEVYTHLRDDTEGLPLWPRAVSSRYAPGSTIKPLVCLAGLMNEAITLDTRWECSGYLLDDYRDRWRCWEIHGTDQRKAHGLIDVVQALTGSCNVFMYRLGEKLGVDRLCSTFDMVGIGRGSGLGLREEEAGINPTPSWLMTARNIRTTPGKARLFAIGQGELSMTPVQVANLMATYADGHYMELRLIRNAEPGPRWGLPVSPDDHLAVKRGMFGVVNDPEGTAYKFAHFVHDRYALAGKTGSATAYPWPTSYRVRYLDEHGEEAYAIIRAGALAPAIDRFQREYPEATFDPREIEVASHWPVDPPHDGDRHSHAWFGGFLQEIDATGRPVWSSPPSVAFAVLVEFGGSGGRTSGPLGKRVAATLLDVLGRELEPE